MASSIPAEAATVSEARRCGSQKRVSEYLEVLAGKRMIWRAMAQNSTSDNPSAFTGQKEQNTPMQECNLTQEAVKAIESVLSKGDRAEVVPVKDGVRIIHVKRSEVKTQNEANLH